MGKEKAITLSDEEVIGVLQRYACGTETKQIVNFLLESKKLDNTKENREAIRQHLRSLNPSSKRFSKSRYGLIYDLAREEYIAVYRQKIRDTLKTTLKKTTERFERLNLLDDKLLTTLENCETLEISTTADFLQVLRECIRLQNTQSDILKNIADISQQIEVSIPDITKADD
ncbi:MAG: hypothetical protein OXI43_05605 [Candidatus Poribacteria bacterium]|nr:hypothetical protein [Candidatus Poribacteria bacterium]